MSERARIVGSKRCFCLLHYTQYVRTYTCLCTQSHGKINISTLQRQSISCVHGWMNEEIQLRLLALIGHRCRLGFVHITFNLDEVVVLSTPRRISTWIMSGSYDLTFTISAFSYSSSSTSCSSDSLSFRYQSISSPLSVS